MRPHMAYLQNTLIKKQLAAAASETETPFRKYKTLLEKARAQGFSDGEILLEFRAELRRIEDDVREGDPIFKEGVQNSKAACMAAIKLMIDEIKGEVNGRD